MKLPAALLAITICWFSGCSAATAASAGWYGGFGGDDGPATDAQLSFPSDVALTDDGGVLIADAGNDRIRKVTPDGLIRTVAGGGSEGF